MCYRAYMAQVNTTYQIRAKVSKSGHILLDERLDEARFEYNATLEDRRRAYKLLGLSIKKQSASVVKNREPLNRTLAELHRLERDLAELEAADAGKRKIEEARRAVSRWWRDWRDDRMKERWPSVEEIESDDGNHYYGKRSDTRRLINSGRILTETRNGNTLLPRRARVGIIERADFAYDGFFKRITRGTTPGFPRFKGKDRFRTISTNSGAENHLSYNLQSRNGMVRIKGFPTLRFKSKRELPVDKDGKVVQPSQISITRKRAGVYLSLSYPIEVKPQREGMPHAPIGIDRGIHALMAFSDGRQSVPGLNENAKAKRRRKRKAQRKINRAGVAKNGKGGKQVACGKEVRRKRNRGNGEYIYFTNGRRKAVEALGRVSERDTLSHRQRLHRYTSKIVKSSDFIAVEDLAIANMTRSAAGDADNPGKGVSAKSGLNRSILEQGWGYIATMLEYKAGRAGIPFVKVEPAYTSQTCAVCGVIDAASRKTRRRWLDWFDCVHCGYENDADVNGAINILSRGLTEAYGSREAETVVSVAVERAFANHSRKRPMANGMHSDNPSSRLVSGKDAHSGVGGLATLSRHEDNPARRKAEDTGGLLEIRGAQRKPIEQQLALFR